jgi:hypothetical protein
MTYWDKIEEAETEARRFLNRVAALRKRYVEDEHIHVAGFKERATRLTRLELKRASMDLSRALVNLRRSY